jgi:16S rRNA G966 N2-methylase RsmD
VNFDYGGAYLDYPLDDEPFIFPDGSTVQVWDIFDGLPDFMRQADVIFVDPPWNQANFTSFYTKAGKRAPAAFRDFLEVIFARVQEINPDTCYIEMGKQHLPAIMDFMNRFYKYATFYISSYYRKQSNICFVARGSRSARRPKLDYMDEEDIIKWVCAHETYGCIGDLCMGRGLVGLYASRNKRRFVGTELNAKRLSVLLKKVIDGGTFARLEGV